MGVEERESVVERMVIVRRVRDVVVERKEKDVVERMGSVRRVRDVERKERDVDVMERKEIVNVRKEKDVDVERRKDVRVIAVRNNLKRSAWLV